MDSEPRHNVDNRLIVVETEAEDLLSERKEDETRKKHSLCLKIQAYCDAYDVN